jgi:hypothetical protein
LALGCIDFGNLLSLFIVLCTSNVAVAWYRTLPRAPSKNQARRPQFKLRKKELGMGRFDLTDFEWSVIEPLLPTNSRGVERVDDRRVLNGIFWRLRTGAPWADIPARYGPQVAADVVEHKGPGQRRYRNRLAFLAPDQAVLEDCQNVVRKKLAWASIVKDGPGPLQLPPAQQKDAANKLTEQETAALNAVRRGWKHLLLPQEPQPGPNEVRGFDLEPVALANPARDPLPLAQIAWKKCEDDGLIVRSLGVLDNNLGKVWQPERPHVSVRQLRDWFAQFPYLSKLREPQVLAQAVSSALARADAKYSIADCYDEVKSEYVGLETARLVIVDLNSDRLLVRREIAEAQRAKRAPETVPTSADGVAPEITGQSAVMGQQPADAPVAKARPRRFYAKITLDPNRPTPQVSNIAQSILSELDRALGATITLTLDIDAEAPDGFSDDVEAVVRDNAASLRITDFGFEGE